MRCNSASDSTLKHLMPTSRAYSISASVLPTPENTTLLASPPASSTRASSPPETISKPEPSLAITFNTAKLEFAFTA